MDSGLLGWRCILPAGFFTRNPFVALLGRLYRGAEGAGFVVSHASFGSEVPPLVVTGLRNRSEPGLLEDESLSDRGGLVALISRAGDAPPRALTGLRTRIDVGLLGGITFSVPAGLVAVRDRRLEPLREWSKFVLR
mmetsp:Transcript_5178/g.14569  ORF Transcript_5178/g.14569 Transcript_5178/m.14569 type:complete len:136 (+) Transcript_5178:198-605(+)